MQERHSDRERYFDEQARTTEKYYIPYIRKCCPELPQEVLEVGVAKGVTCSRSRSWVVR